MTKSVEKINFSPIETSTNPYFKYCVTQMKEEQKNDNSINIENSNNLKINNKELLHKEENIEKKIIIIIQKKIHMLI